VRARVVPEPMRIQREGAQLQIRGTWSAGPGDDQARFLADLRALRDSAAIGYDELAARAHYPSDVLKEAENGPSLPGLPILSAYVRACEGDVLDWEERWRRLNPEVADDPNLPVRPAGASAAAVAGARAGIGVAPPDVYDPDRIRAALRGNQSHSDQADRRAGDPGVAASAGISGFSDQGFADQGMDSGQGLDGAAPLGSGLSWDTVTDPAVPKANGNHSSTYSSRGPFDAAFTSTPDSAERTEAAQAEEFSWLAKSEPESGAADSSEPAWTERTEAGFGWRDRADTGLTSPSEAESALPEPEITEQIPRYQDDGPASSSERTDFWGQPLSQASADLQVPAAAPRAEEPPIPRATWPSAAGTAAAQTAQPAHRTTADAGLGTATAAQSHSPAAPSYGQGTPSHSQVGPAAQTAVAQRAERRQDRFFTARLLVVIVIAALIGSVLVLLLR